MKFREAILWWIPCLFTYFPLVPCGFLVISWRNDPTFQVAPSGRHNDLGDLGEVSPSSQDGFLVDQIWGEVGYPLIIHLYGGLLMDARYIRVLY